MRLRVQLRTKSSPPRGCYAKERASGRRPHTEENWLRRDYSRHMQTLTDTHRHQEERLRNVNIHGLLHTKILGSGLLHLGSGAHLQKSDLPRLDVGGKSVGEVLGFYLININTTRFQLRESVSPSPAAAHSFRLLRDLLVFSYPAMLLLRSDGPSALRARLDADIEWTVRVTGFTRELVMNRGPGDEVLGKVHSMHDAERLARRHRVGHKVKFDPHPSLSAILPVWDSQRLARGGGLRAIVAAAAWARAKQATANRAATAAAEHAPIATALSSVSWKNIHKMPHTTSRQRLCLFQVKSGRLNGYTQVLGKHGCPHCPQAGAIGGKASHILWTCPQAQLLWRTIRALWTELGAWVGHDAATENEYLQVVFRVKLSAVPTKAWDLPMLARLDHNQHRGTTEVYPTLQSVWQQHVLTTFTTIMQWRQGMHDEHRAWSRRQAQGIHHAAIRNATRQLRHELSATADASRPGPALLADLLGLHDPAETHRAVPEAPPAQQPRHLLFFDGGSRGNPGPCGAGAVIIATDHTASTARIVWSASISMANVATTNNQAEYPGVVAGLGAAVAYRLTQLEVIGDSALILDQLQHYRPPRNTKLIPLYATARRLADQTGVKAWHHHLRSYNKMADHVANVAMDRRDSIQVQHPTTRSEHSQLQHLLPGDFSHWQESASCRLEQVW